MAENKAKEAEAKRINVRVLADTTINGIKIKCGRVAVIKGNDFGIDDAVLDCTPEAVAYALTEYPDIIDPYAAL